MTDETNGSGAGEHRTFSFGQGSYDGDACRDCPWEGPPGSAGNHRAETVPATPDAADASECCWNYPHAAHETPCIPAASTGANDADVKALAMVLSGASPEFAERAAVTHMSQARRLLASDWLTARESAAATRARAEERERIAQAIEADDTGSWTPEHFAAIARSDA